MPEGAPWIVAPYEPSTTIDGETYSWSNRIVWGDNIIWGDNIVWGNNIIWGDNIIWGNSVLTGEAILAQAEKGHRGRLKGQRRASRSRSKDSGKSRSRRGRASK